MITKTSEAFEFDTIDDVVSDIAKGKLVIVTDDADRENEAIDRVAERFAASLVSSVLEGF